MNLDEQGRVGKRIASLHAQLTAANARAVAAEATAEKLLQMERDRFANFEAAFGTLPKPMAEAARPTPVDREDCDG